MHNIIDKALIKIKISPFIIYIQINQSILQCSHYLVNITVVNEYWWILVIMSGPLYASVETFDKYIKIYIQYNCQHNIMSLQLEINICKSVLK